MPPLGWSRLQRGYQDDDKIVDLRLSFGYMAEAFHTRFVAHGESIRCPVDREFEVLAVALGFERGEASEVQAIAEMAREIALCTRERVGGHRAQIRPVVVWDLLRRSNYALPKSATPGYEAEKKRRQRAQSVPISTGDRVPGQERDMSPSTNERTDVLTNGRTELGSSSTGNVGSRGGAGGEPDVFDESAIEDLVDNRFAEALGSEEHPDDFHLWLKVCRRNRLFADVWPGVFGEIREEHGDQVLTEVLRRAVDRELEAVSFPRAWVMTLVDEVANGCPEQASDEAGKEIDS